jgi:hypothetical protein
MNPEAIRAFKNTFTGGGKADVVPESVEKPPQRPETAQRPFTAQRPVTAQHPKSQDLYDYGNENYDDHYDMNVYPK